MKHFKRDNVYKASNVEFNPTTMIATSYAWWEFVKVINGYVVFNSYSYSSSTCKHQSKVRSLLDKLGIKIDLEVKTSYSLNGNSRSNYGLDSKGALLDAIKGLEQEILELQDILSNNRRKKSLDTERQAAIESKLELIAKIGKVIHGNKLKVVLK